MNPLHIALAFATLILAFGVATFMLNSAKLNALAALDREREAHLKATKTNRLLQKANDNAVKEIETLTEKLESAMSIIDEQRIQIKRLDIKLNHAEADRVELRAERLTAENKLAEVLSKVRQRNAKGQFLPRGVMQTKYNDKGVAVDLAKFGNDILEGLTKPSHRLTHGMTVKTPTEDEAKAIFAEAKRLGVRMANKPSRNRYCIWFSDEFGLDWGNDTPITGEEFVTASEFIARMQPLKRVADLGEKEVIHCPTFKEAEDICNLLAEAGFKTKAGDSFAVFSNKWKFYKEHTHYYPREGMFGTSDTEGYTIHQAADFLQTQANKG